MPGFIAYPYTGESLDGVLTDALTRLVDTIPGWTPRETHLEYALLSELVRHALDTRLLAADVAESIFRGFGTRLIGLEPRPGTPATGTVTFTLSDTTGRTVPAGTELVWTGAGGTALSFRTVTDVTAAPGATETPGVQAVADEPGEAGNGLPTGPVTVVDALSYVTGARATTSSTGGTDPEPDADYLDRLAQSLTLLRRIPVLAGDYAVLARDVPGVHRALALDGYNPTTGTYGNERTITVAAVDDAGQPLPANVTTALRDRLASEREVNFVVNVLAPTYTTVNVTYTVRAAPNTDPAVVLADTTAAVRAFLSPASWAGGLDSPPAWRNDKLVRYLDVAAVLGRTAGVSSVTALTLNGGTSNVTLAGEAALPSASSTVTGTVTA